MAGISNNLYPPLIPTWMPSFDKDSECRVYFSLSIYNDSDDIKNVQVIVNYQNNNLSALNSTKYPAGIKIDTLKVNNDIQGDNKYYITLSKSDLEGGEFVTNQIYKVQVRFTGTGASAFTSYSQMASWLVTNQSYFSEWSTVCLIKGIEAPTVILKGFEEGNSEDKSILTAEVTEFIGDLVFPETGEVEKEYLKSYRFVITNTNKNTITLDSGQVYTETYAPNEILYTLDYALEDGVSYSMVLSYETNNGYTGSKSYYFSFISSGIDSLNATISAETDNDNGRIKVNVLSTTMEPFLGNITIRRSSNKSNFTIWQDVHTTPIKDGTALNYTWYDYTAESGVWYKYCVQKRNRYGQRGITSSTRTAVMLDLDDMFLTNKNMQLRIKYDPSISSFKRTVIESKTETLGSKYPFIKRNSAVDYKTFTISGLITSFCDEDGIFINKSNVYGDYEFDYEYYNTENQISNYQDYIYEKEFRNKILDFLYDSSVKLFRSNTEGNVLVKLMDISCTPNQSLGRMLYSFSATAYEIDECTLSNYDTYDVIEIGDYDPYVERVYTKVSQIAGTYSGTARDVFKTIKEQESLYSNDEYITEADYLTWMRITFESDPYMVQIGSDGSLTPATSATTNSLLGYIVYINGSPIFVNRRGYYELADNDTNVTSIYFPIATTVTVDYIVQNEQYENTSKLARLLYYYTKVGQVYGTYACNEYISKEIYLKYLLDYPKYYEKLLSITQMHVEADPGAVLYVKDAFDDGYYRHIIGSTGELSFFDEDTTIEGFYFKGKNLVAAENDTIRENEYVETGITVSSIAEITDPIYHGVYTIGGNRMIFYNNDWYDFTEENDVQCDVDALIDYIYESVKGVY
jgi:hypothetical protein